MWPSLRRRCSRTTNRAAAGSREPSTPPQSVASFAIRALSYTQPDAERCGIALRGPGSRQLRPAIPTAIAPRALLARTPTVPTWQRAARAPPGTAVRATATPSSVPQAPSATRLARLCVPRAGDTPRRAAVPQRVSGFFPASTALEGLTRPTRPCSRAHRGATARVGPPTPFRVLSVPSRGLRDGPRRATRGRSVRLAHTSDSPVQHRPTACAHHVPTARSPPAGTSSRARRSRRATPGRTWSKMTTSRRSRSYALRASQAPLPTAPTCARAQPGPYVGPTSGRHRRVRCGTDHANRCRHAPRHKPSLCRPLPHRMPRAQPAMGAGPTSLRPSSTTRRRCAEP
mmetsp:Transcript_13466/g.34545  ORF Transcript_13466/g.34545 Transcript_13466/m.34545 type:complete len:343 (-) Transcript_13466:694-1722(-)